MPSLARCIRPFLTGLAAGHAPQATQNEGVEAGRTVGDALIELEGEKQKREEAATSTIESWLQTYQG